MKALRKIWGIPFPLAVLIALVLTYALIFGNPTRIVWSMKKEAASNPRLSVVPIPLSDKSISPAKGTPKNFFGYQFEVPWQGGEQKQRESIAVVISQSSQEAVMFFDPTGQQGFIRMMKETPGLRVAYLNPLYGRENIQSDYEFARAALNASPSQLSLFLPWSKEVYAANLLRMKEGFLFGPQPELYSFEFGPHRPSAFPETSGKELPPLNNRRVSYKYGRYKRPPILRAGIGLLTPEPNRVTTTCPCL